jgi:hypothetical protein
MTKQQVVEWLLGRWPQTIVCGSLGVLFGVLGWHSEYGWGRDLLFWCSGVQVGYVVMWSMHPRMTEKWREQMRAEMIIIAAEVIDETRRELFAMGALPNTTADTSTRLQ